MSHAAPVKKDQSFLFFHKSFQMKNNIILPGYWLSYHVPPKHSDFSRIVNFTPISFSLIAASIPENPEPTKMENGFFFFFE